MKGHGQASPAMAAYAMYAERFGDDGAKFLRFGQYVEQYMNNGYVFSTPDVFLVARPVMRDADAELIADPLYPFLEHEIDAWFVAIAAGDPRLFWTFCPFELDYVGYQRTAAESIRWLNANTHRRIIMGSSKKPKDPPPPTPPPTTDNKDAELAARQAKIAAANRRGAKSTILSQQNSGTNAPYAGGGKSILS